MKKITIEFSDVITADWVIRVFKNSIEGSYKSGAPRLNEAIKLEAGVVTQIINQLDLDNDEDYNLYHDMKRRLSQ